MLLAAIFSAVAALIPVNPAMPQRPDYPAARTTNHVDHYHGIEVKDPYRWLENLDSKETQAWVNAEDRLTARWLDSFAPR